MKMKKRRERLEWRQRDFALLMQRSSDAKVQMRKDNNGYRCPGSTKR